MVRFGELINAEYLLCHNHTIHLAVLESLFKTKNNQNIQNNTEPSGNDSTDQIQSENEIDDDTNDEDDDDQEEESEKEESGASTVYELADSFIPTKERMRSIIKMFKNSPLKLNTLKEIRKKDGLKELKLILDVKTRWNSLVKSGERFLFLLPSILKAMRHRDIKSVEVFYIGVLSVKRYQ